MGPPGKETVAVTREEAKGTWPRADVPSTEVLREKCRVLRRDVLRMTFLAASGHPGGSFSMAELVTSLYNGWLRVDPARPKWADRDRFVLSKGHCCAALYAALTAQGYFPRAELDRFRRIDSLLQGHTSDKIPGVDFSAGSLGQGLSFGNGVALAGRLDKRDYHVWVMMGDGEVQEGSVWEAAMTTSYRGLDNLTAILDYNKVQIDGFVRDVKDLEPVVDKWKAFGWHVVEIDGHDLSAIQRAFQEAVSTRGKPTMIVAHTVKGKGVSFMENKAEFHGRSLKAEELAKAYAELGFDVRTEGLAGVGR